MFPMVVRCLRLVKLRKQGCWLQMTFANHDSVLTDSTRRCLTGKSILTLDPEHRENRKATSGQENLNNGLDLRLMLKQLVERSFAHCYETGGLRRCYRNRLKFPS
jgi:hypothetical protein